MNAAEIMENVHRTVTIHMEATTVLVIVNMYSLLIKMTVMVRRLCFILTAVCHLSIIYLKVLSCSFTVHSHMAKILIIIINDYNI